MSSWLLCEASGTGSWSFSPGSVAARLQSVELQIVIAVVGALVLLRIYLRSTVGAGAPAAGEVSDIVPLTLLGPVFAGSRVKVSMPGDKSEQAIDGVIQVIDPSSVTITVPFSASLRIRAGTVVHVLSPSAGVAFGFTVSVIDRRVCGKELALSLGRPEWVERIQRRENHRIRLDVPATASRIDPHSPTSDLYHATVRDLSAAGMHIGLPFLPPIGAILRVRIQAEGLNDTSYEARVVRTDRTEWSRSGMWGAGCEILWLDEGAQARLTRACLDLERQLRTRS